MDTSLVSVENVNVGRFDNGPIQAEQHRESEE